MRLYTEGWHKSRAGKRGKEGQHGFGGSNIQQPQAPKHTRLSMLINVGLITAKARRRHVGVRSGAFLIYSDGAHAA